MSTEAYRDGAPLMPAEVDRIIGNKIEEDYGLLRYTPGFCLEPLSWDRMRQLVEEATEQSLGVLGRHPSDIVIYRAFRAKLLLTYASIADYVRIKKLDYQAVTTEDGKQAAGAEPSESTGRPHISFMTNDFPYNMEPGIEHHNLWSTRALSEQEVHQAINNHRSGFETLYWKNPESLASIPSVWHGHILSRKAGQQKQRKQ